MAAYATAKFTIITCITIMIFQASFQIWLNGWFKWCLAKKVNFGFNLKSIKVLALVTYYLFSSLDSAGLIYDASGNGSHATLYGGVVNVINSMIFLTI